MSETLVRVDGVSKKFCRSLKKSLWYGMQDLGREITGHRHGGNGELRPDEFWAVKDVSFELKRGECLGLIGHNGAGKTTMLKMLNGLVKPDVGCIEVRGKVGSIIALGAGFNPILTGRENIYVNASILGLNKIEIDNKIHEIIEFSELGEFIDSPVQSYSSGMTVRLGFAIASIVEPDVLLLDEVLAVGDTAFKFKCYSRMDRLLENTAVIFVSHDMPQLARICNRSLLLDGGRISYSGNVLDGILRYNKMSESRLKIPEKVVLNYPPVRELDIDVLFDEIDHKSPLPVRIKVVCDEDVGFVDLRIDVKNFAGNFVASCVALSESYNVALLEGENIWNLEIASLPLKSGVYTVGINLANQHGKLISIWSAGHTVEVKGGHPGIVPECQLSVSHWK